MHLCMFYKRPVKCLQAAFSWDLSMALEDLCAHVLVDFEQIAALAVLQHGLVHVDDGGVAAHGGAGLHGFGVGLRGFLGGFQYQWVE